MITLKEYRELYNEEMVKVGATPISKQRVWQWLAEGRIEGSKKIIGRWFVEEFKMPKEKKRPEFYNIKNK